VSSDVAQHCATATGKDSLAASLDLLQQPLTRWNRQVDLVVALVNSLRIRR
jgi:hypothetical protein